MREQRSTFACFGGTCTVVVAGDSEARSARAAVEHARRRLLAWHARFTRFSPASELARLNADPREAVPVGDTLAALIEAILAAARRTGGLVDGTLVQQLERAGYRATLGAPLPPQLALRLAPERRPAHADPRSRWRAVTLDRRRGVVRRPPGVAFDSGGLGKGLFADLLAAELAGHASFAIDCAGDLRVGGTARLRRSVQVAEPLGASVLHTFALAGEGVATSGISKRSWLDPSGSPAHHILDPATGRPAYTGVVQATALAPTAVEAELLAKAALLSGPEGARGWLEHGGVLVYDDGTVEVSEQRGRQAALARTPLAPARSR